MASLQIRDLPQDLYEALSLRAEQEGRSLSQQALHELRRLPELTAAERRREVLRRVGERARSSGLRDLSPAPEELIREDRER
ncbi:MAG TPA: hypothetical protein VF017_18100 [Thermoanaerobaculia bacterium]|nr:hypothetical protein [Thermoanaerobaculia bacterium]